jgi:hypothetical protein
MLFRMLANWWTKHWIWFPNFIPRFFIELESKISFRYRARHGATKSEPHRMNTKDFLRLGVPLGEATRRAADVVAKFIPGGGGCGLVDLWVKHVILGV